MLKKKGKDITPEELDEMVKIWVVVPYVMAELFKRARGGDRVAKSILAVAQSAREYDAFQAQIRRIIG